MNKFCTYLTIYSGDKLPPFYIGSTSIAKIHSGYHGSVLSKKYKFIWNKELNDNPHLFKTIIISFHENRSDATSKEYKIQKQLNVVKNDLYINQAYATHNGFTDMDKTGKNNPMYGSSRTGESNPMWNKKHTLESREKMSKSGKGKNSKPKTDDHKNAIRESHANRSKKEKMETSEKISKVHVGIPKTESQKLKISITKKLEIKTICEYCGTPASKANYTRWHGVNCRKNF